MAAKAAKKIKEKLPQSRRTAKRVTAVPSKTATKATAKVAAKKQKETKNKNKNKKNKTGKTTKTSTPAKKIKASTPKPAVQPVKKTNRIKAETAIKAAKKSQESPRLVINNNGRIVFASDTFAKTININPTNLIGREASSLFIFENPEDALHDRPMMMADDSDALDPWAQSIIPGDHAVIIKDPTNLTATQAITLKFDRITLDNNNGYLLITEPEDMAYQENPTGLQSYLETLFIANKPVAETTQEIPSFQKSLNENDLKSFLNMTYDLALLISKDGHILHTNETFDAILGYTQEDLKDLTFLDLVHVDDRSHIRPIIRSMILNDDGIKDHMIAFECRVQAKDGKIHWLEWRQRRTNDKIYAVCRDLTEVKEHESALIRHQRQLSEAQSIGRMGHWHWHVGDDVLDFSNEIYRIFGMDKESFKPTLDNVNRMLHRRDIGRMTQALQRAMIEQKNYEMEFRIIRPDGQTRFIRLQGRCELDAEDDVTALFGIMQDITERTHYEREMRAAKESAERAYAAKSQFLANMSHELRTPLNAIIGFSEMMQRQLLGPIGTEKYLDYIAGIRESGEHLLDLISDILDMSKIEAGKYELDLESFNLVKVIRLSTHMMEGRALDAQVRISNDFNIEEHTITADRRAIMQILLNVLSNSVKFTEPGGKINVECTPKDSSVIIKITDTGIGIPANKLNDVTRPFEQAANQYSRDHEGSGLGLAITKDLTELHGGNLHIESTVGVGTVVTIRLPNDCSTTRRDKNATIPIQT